MGIPGFFPRMVDAGLANVASTIGQDRDECHTLAIIDGPAYAHFIYKDLGSRHGANGSPVSRIGTPVTYKQCAAEAIHWLQQLERFGFTIETIFFDGALPPGKLKTRRDRLAKYAHNLDTYQKIHEQVHNGRSTMQDNGRLKHARRDLPPPPFLVTAVLEALAISQYADKTYVVPGEADNFCVAAARKASADQSPLRVGIFTNDSDLAVYRSGEETRIILLNTIEQVSDTGTPILQATEYWPSGIEEKAKCKDLVQLAWHLLQDRHTTVRKALSLMKPGAQPHDVRYQDFAAQYLVDAEEKALAALRSDEAYRVRLLGLDARICELVVQAEAAKDTSMQAPDLLVFLPFLIEDASRTSAWRVGRSLRSVAYMLLLTACDCRQATVFEYRRVGTGVSPWELKDWAYDSMGQLLESCMSLIEGSLAEQNELSLLDCWHFIVAKLMLLENQQNDLLLPPSTQLSTVLLGVPPGTWDLVGVCAHYQATYYSLRILFQVLQYVSHAYGIERMSTADCEHLNLDNLLRLLQGLPGIADFFLPDTTAACEAKKQRHNSMLEGYMATLDARRATDPQPRKKKRKRRQDSEAKEAKPDHDNSNRRKAEGKSLASNPFAALAD